MQVHLRALGCRLNEAELETWAHEFRRIGHGITRSISEADVVVLNTCAVTREAVRKSRQAARRLQRDNPRARIVLSGCYATLEPDRAFDELGVDLVVGNRDKTRLVDIAVRELDLATAPAMATEPGASALFARGRERAFVKIQDGCRYRCTFCVVTIARGDERSRPVHEIVREINRLHVDGIQEVVLTGVHVGGYGSDLGTKLETLVQSILADSDVRRIRFASVEPWDLSDSFVDLFADPRIMPHIHLPLQSGSDTVLRRMARRCSTSAFRTLVAHLRDAVPDFNVTTDIIVGFPGETEREWNETKAFVEEMAFGHLHIFPYSQRESTKAARLPGPVPADLRKARCRELHEIGSRLRRLNQKSHVGRTVPVLWEGVGDAEQDGGIRFKGYTPNYLRASTIVPQSMKLGGTIARATIVGLSDEGDGVDAHLLRSTQYPQ